MEEELTLLLLYLTSWEEKVLDQPISRSWKGYPFEILNELEQKGLIAQRKRSKSVYLTEAGKKFAEKLKNKYANKKLVAQKK